MNRFNMEKMAEDYQRMLSELCISPEILNSDEELYSTAREWLKQEAAYPHKIADAWLQANFEYDAKAAFAEMVRDRRL